MTSASTFSEQPNLGQPEQSARRAEQQQMDRSSLPTRQPPLADMCWLHREQPVPGQPYVIISQQAIQQVDEHARSNLRTELGGALLGKAYRHEDKVFVEVRAALTAVSADHGPVHFTFNADTWAQFQQDRAAHYPDLDIVGWFHTHPALGVFYSSDDVVVHSAAFTLPWHVGLVIDPNSQEAGFFGWVNGQLAPFSGCYELLEQQGEPVMPWKIVRTAVWYDGVQEGADVQIGVYAPPGTFSRWPSLPPQASLLLSIAGLLLSLILLIGGVLPLAAKAEQLQAAVLGLSAQALADTNVVACADSRLRILTPVSGTAVSQGSSIPVIGTTTYPDAASYRVELRPAGGESWALLNSSRRSTELGQLALWRTADYRPGLYELRLTAVDRNNVRLSQSPGCQISLELGP